MRDKVIELGIERGYLPTCDMDEDNIEAMFNTQYLRLIKELGEASDEVRKGDKEAFEMELGDVLVLLTNCKYIQEDNIKLFFHESIEKAEGLLSEILLIATDNFHDSFLSTDKQDHCLSLAYNKIKSRGGILIDGDFFKPGDKEYEEYFKNK